MNYYINIFTGCTRKFENGVGYVLNADTEWVRNKTPESLIKSLPYYKQRMTTS